MTHNCIVKSLYDYPGVIADLEEDLLIDTEARKEAEENLAYWLAEQELAIAVDSEYRNEAMRKAAKVKLQQESPKYYELNQEVTRLTLREKRSQIRLDRHKREFSVLKLERKMAIAVAEQV